MCGITGWFDLNKDPDKISKHLDGVVASMHHRGPDSDNVQIFSDCQ